MLTPEWRDRLNHWTAVLTKEFYEPLAAIDLESFCTYDMLSPEEAEKGSFAPVTPGTEWGRMWEYCWMRGDITLPEAAKGHRIVMNLQPGGEATLFVNGEAFGTCRAGKVRVPHQFFSDQELTLCAKAGEKYHLLMEVYAGHDYPMNDNGWTALGPVRPDSGDTYRVKPENEIRKTLGSCTYGIWHEDAYQLWKDVNTLTQLLEQLDDFSLRASKVEEALERFTVLVTFDGTREERLASYREARKAIAPALQAKNGDTVPQFYAIGNSHIDICWLWPYRETQRKVARTFAAQLRLMDQYPEYKYIQSQPEAYLICKTLYPKLYERIKEKIRNGQWIADGSMWVEPDTNVPGGEALVRQLLYGKMFYRKEFGVECSLLWLPDTFGYSAVLPQLLKKSGVKYLTTQKIFWSYNGGDRFPYHYFTWQGMDGTEITSFLHLNYTNQPDAKTVAEAWKNRVQKRNLTKFLLPFGYGDGGGGPTRDNLEDIRRLENLEGIPKVTMTDPCTFFDDCAAEGAPANRYTGELYFSCHRGTYTSQAAVKKGNRRSELSLREAEIWSVAAAKRLAYPQEALDAAWKKLLLCQFHDILPGSCISEVYDMAHQLHKEVIDAAEGLTADALKAIGGDKPGLTCYNALSWERKAVIKTPDGYARAVIPPMGRTSVLDDSVPERPVSVAMEGDCAVLDNGLLRAVINENGEIVSCTDEKGHERLSAPGNVLKMYRDVPRRYEAWDIDSNYECCPVELAEKGRLEITENTPWRCEVTVIRRVNHSTMVQRLSLETGSRRVNIACRVDWQEQQKMLKVAFPTGIYATEALNEIQFGYIRRPTHRSRLYDRDRFEVCNHRYTALCEENRGAAVLNDCKYGVSTEGDTIALTLLRAPKSPDFDADVGRHEFTYAYYVWDGPLMDSRLVQEGYELNVPVRTVQGAAEEFSMMRVDAANVIIDTVKAAEDGSGDIIVRMYESLRTHTDTVLRLACREATECNLMEEEPVPLTVEGGAIPLSFHPFEVKTIRVKM